LEGLHNSVLKVCGFNIAEDLFIIGQSVKITREASSFFWSRHFFFFFF